MPGVRMGAEERETIALGVAREDGFAEVARRMGRPTSTVSREVHGYAKGGASYGYTRELGYHSLVATRAGTGGDQSLP